jgi:hypothetical protein
MAGDGDWGVSDVNVANGEWFVWNKETAEQHSELVDAVAAFEAQGKNEKAAGEATAWLKHAALDEAACVTRILVADNHVLAFYALASGEISLTSGRKLKKMGIEGGVRVGSSHVEWIGRDYRAPAGAGIAAIQHAIVVAVRVAALQGNRALTMDPYDAETQAMWESKGFHKSQTELAEGLRRLYVPLFGMDYGRLERFPRRSAD